MSQKVMTRDEVREFDRRAIEQLGVPGIVLMENAGRGCAELIKGMNGSGGRVVIFCGPGNNGGDGYVIARHLELMGIDVKVVVVCEKEKIKGDAKINLEIIEKLGLDICYVDSSDSVEVSSTLNRGSLIVDAIFGTGITGEVRQEYLPLIEIITAIPLPVFSVDSPSGLDCDTGLPLGDAVEANITGTFVAMKQGFRNPDSKRYTGNVTVIDIGVPCD